MERKLTRIKHMTTHCVAGRYVERPPAGVWGDLSGVSGDLSGVSGNLSGVSGDLSGVSGNVDECGLSEADRKRGVNIEDLIHRAAK